MNYQTMIKQIIELTIHNTFSRYQLNNIGILFYIALPILYFYYKFVIFELMFKLKKI